MKCLCCGRTLVPSNEIGWHTACIKSFFGTNKLPNIDVSEHMLEQLATESTNKGYTVPGVQKKLSLHLTTTDEPRLTLVNYPTGYILKPQTEEYKALPEAEYIVMQMAKITGIKTVPFALIRLKAQQNSYAYITKRIDRLLSNTKEPQIQMLAMEDFCQLEGRLTQDKYHGSYERCAKVICKYSIQKQLDLTELFMRILFSYVVGNSDMHLKNFSLIETAYKSGKYVLSSAYDMLPVNVVLPEDPETFALTLNGKKQNIRKKDFFIYAEAIGIPQKATEKIISKVISMEGTYVSMCKESFLPKDMKESLIQLISQRIDVLR